MSLLDALERMSRRFDELEALIVVPEVIKDQQLYTGYLKERGGLKTKVEAFRDYRRAERELHQARAELEVLAEPGERELFEAEIENLEAELERGFEKLRELFVTDDEDANRDVIMEIRAGTGGDEAALFAGDLFDMYSRYAESRAWKVEILEATPGTVGGFKEIVVNLKGEGVFKRLRYESGGHRVQRVPATETQGRIHTSAATVAVLPEADEVEVDIREDDLRIDAFRSSGPGGQSVNKTSSAIRVTHVPTGVVVSCQDEKSQHKNKDKALRILAARLYELESRKKNEERSSTRKAMIGSGDRSERIRTYNFPQNRITDHRINLSLHSLDRALEGELDDLIEPLMDHDKELKLQSLEE